jgi:hypothetical protein
MLTLKEGGAKMKVRHVIWMSPEGRCGRVGVVEWGDAVAIKSLSRRRLPVEILFGVLDATIKNWRNRAEVLHLRRKHGWKPSIRVGMSGCMTLYLRSCKDNLFMDYPIVASIHVTMSGYIEGFEMWLGDLAPLAASLMKHVHQLEFQRDDDIWIARTEEGIWSLKVVEPIERNFEPAGNPSGLVDGIPEEFWDSLESEPEQASPAQEEEKSQGGRLPEIEIV